MTVDFTGIFKSFIIVFIVIIIVVILLSLFMVWKWYEMSRFEVTHFSAACRHFTL